MLIEKSVAVNDVVSFRLTSGEELLAKLTGQDDASITVSKPVVVQMQMVGPSQAGLAFAPFMATADEATSKFRFERSRLICDPIKPRSDISSQYVKMTTGLDIPTSPTSLLKA